MLRYCLSFFILMITVNKLYSSILDNKTRPEIAANETVIRAERNDRDKKQIYMPGPYIAHYNSSAKVCVSVLKKINSKKH